ncbi:MAG TPA: stage II sporulation protein M, partial [Luteitalea sp.]|nr:stage II sporulation protein M [Luteitalea sp.]
FRRLCHDLALAQDRDYSLSLVQALQARVLAAHQSIYGAAGRPVLDWRTFLTRDLPRLVRAERRLVLAAATLLLGPLALLTALVIAIPAVADLVLDTATRVRLEHMYDPAAAGSRVRGAAQDWQMYGFYIANNVRIDFQCFAGGILFGAGSVFFLLANGVIIGAAAGHVTAVGGGVPFWSFVAGHSAFELIGAVLSGASGLMLGRGLLAPGVWPRRHALALEARRAVPLLVGAALLTALAAIVEAFWSPLTSVPPDVKYIVGLALWALTVLYLVRAGRDAD